MFSSLYTKIQDVFLKERKFSHSGKCKFPQMASFPERREHSQGQGELANSDGGSSALGLTPSADLLLPTCSNPGLRKHLPEGSLGLDPLVISSSEQLPHKHHTGTHGC